MVFDFLKRREEGKTRYMHVAIDATRLENWCEKHKVGFEDCYVRVFSRMKEHMAVQVEQKIPIMSFFVLHLKADRKEELLKLLKRFIEGKWLNNFLNENKIRVTFFGKWYDLPSELVDSLKKLVEMTKNYDYFFVNFCLNYDGREELVDAFKIINRQIMAGKLSPESVTQEVIKENIYTSYFLPPDLIIRDSRDKRNSFLLWDSVGAKIVSIEKFFPDFDKRDFEKVLKG